MDKLVAMLRAAGDPTRLRLLLLLRQVELTVSELIEIVGQSQPRVSRHLKLLCEAGLLERFKEGSWVFHRAVEDGAGALLTALLSELAAEEPSILALDKARLSQVRLERAKQAAAFFKANASEWNRIRALHAPDKDVEVAILNRLGNAPIENLLDAGTGTGRMLELLGGRVKRAVGVDVSPEMLAIARDKLAKPELSHCRVRLGDIFRLPFDGGEAGFDAVLFHQVLHYLDDPAAAVAEAARTMRKGGRLLIADFAPHELEFLRTDFAHRRLGFSDKEVQGWLHAAKLKYLGAEAIAPHGSAADKLTVKLWLAASPPAAKAEAT
jgi:SAM-dependent methyltransferase/DNA-binding transcriptional ArsR family regulator